MEFRPDARPSPIAGTWYTSDAVVLSRQMEDLVQAAKIKKSDLTGKVIGLLVPHAGHRYSGRTAAYAYKAIAERPRKIVAILSPFHQYFPADFMTTDYRAYQTPLGDVEIAQTEMNSLNEQLASHGLKLTQVNNEGEHSLEIQLPFLQSVWKTDFSLLPIMVRTHDSRKIRDFAAALYEVLPAQDSLIIASSDLSHFFPLEIAQTLDAETLQRVSRFSPEDVLSGADDNSAPACGAGAIAAMLYTTKLMGAGKVQILNYSTSADSTGDNSSVVGYGSAAVFLPV